MPTNTKKPTTSQPTPNAQVKLFLWGSVGLIVLAAIGFIAGSSLLLFNPRSSKDKKITNNDGITTKTVLQKETSGPDPLITKASERQKVTYPPITFIDPQLGPQDAPITIIEFSDFSCPYCADAQSTLGQLFVQYPNQIRLVWKNLPITQLHPSAGIAAEAALCAGEQDKFWEYHDLLFANQDYFTNDVLINFAKELNLNTNSFSSCLESGKMTPRVEKTIQEAKDLLISGTPHFYINKQEISGAAELEDFVRIVEVELKK